MIQLDASRRDEAIQAGWRAYADRLAGFEDRYQAFCSRWNVTAVVADGAVIGALFSRDGVIHIGIVPEWRGRWASRRVIREMLSHGRKTTVEPWEEECKQFIGRIGFKPSAGGYEIEGDCRVYHR